MSDKEHEIRVGDTIRIKDTDMEDVVIDIRDDNIFLKNNGCRNIKSCKFVVGYDKEQLARLMNGDMEAFDKLMPNVLPEHRKNFETIFKMLKEMRADYQAFVLMLSMLYVNNDGFKDAVEKTVKIFEDLKKSNNNDT